MTTRSWKSQLRTTWKLMVAFSCALALVPACRGRVAEPEAARQAPITLRVIGEGYPPLLAFEKVKTSFERATGINVEIVKRDHMAVVAEMDREFAAGRVTYDLVVMPHRLLGKLVEKGHVQSIAGYLADESSFDRKAFDPERDLFPGWWHEISWYGGKPYGFPFMALSMYTWYRKDLFESAEEQAKFAKRFGRRLAPPRSWGEFEDLAAYFHRPSQGLYGTSIQGQRHIALWYEWLSYATGFGAAILDSPEGDKYGDIVVNSPNAVAATEFYVKMLAYSSPEALNHNWDDALSNFQQGRTALALMWLDSAPWVEDPKESRVAGRVGYAPPPSATGRPTIQLEGHTFLIPTRAPHPAEAFRLMAWALSHDAQVAQTLAGGLSARLSTYSDSRVAAIPYLAAFRTMVDSAAPKPTIPEADQIAEMMTLELSRILAKEVTPKAGLDKVATDLHGLLGSKAALRYPPK